MLRTVGVAILLAVLGSILPTAQPLDQAAVPVIIVTGPTVVAFWKQPTSDAELVNDPDLASALDEQQYYWAESRAQLAALGIDAVDQPGRRFWVRDQERDRLFSAPPDSAVIGYLLAEPGRDPHAVYRLHYPAQLLAVARSHFGLSGG